MDKRAIYQAPYPMEDTGTTDPRTGLTIWRAVGPRAEEFNRVQKEQVERCKEARRTEQQHVRGANFCSKVT